MEGGRRPDAGAGVVIAVALIAGCLPSGSTEPSPTDSAAPSLSTAPSSTASAVAICDASAHTEGVLDLRLEHVTETGRDWVIAVYEDGRILTPGTVFQYEYADDAWLLVRRLTPEGRSQLVDLVENTGLFESSASYNPVLLPGAKPPGHGAAGYAVTVLRNGEYVEVRWTSMFEDEDLYYEPSPEREELDAMGTELVSLDEWLPDNAWLPGETCTYEPQKFQVIVGEPQTWGGDLEDLPADIADIAWPLGGDILAWGEPFSVPWSDRDVDGRCGTVTRAEAINLVDTLAAAGAEGPADSSALDRVRFVSLRLGDQANVQIYDVSLEALMPNAPGDCSNPEFPYSPI